ncbi:hypothetical protein Vadar_009318 [Vaccinium darrowii]|uniref:Uncharacterized protein n=1 Tax=Vaccinium darrowii TaxID=229202 RepID=A0ACB7WZQ4_9ERIC|nr:hypothetical protein Vadar_009318 [Vaccinium darrowii]
MQLGAGVFGTQPNKPIKGKEKAAGVNDLVDVQIDEEDDSDAYELEHETSSDDEEVFYDSDYGFSDDDELFQQNIDADTEFDGLVEKQRPQYDEDYTRAVDELVDIEGVDESSDELDSLDDSSDEEGGSKKKKMKYPVFNENTDMENPVFKVGMEFKTHAFFREAVKEHSIKWGKKVKFVKSDREKVRAICNGKKKCPWLIYASYVPADAVYRIKRFCVRHLYNNFKGNFKGLALKDIMWKAAKASTVPSFKNAMQEMHDLDRNAYNWLYERPPVNWSRSHFTTYPRCDILLNNLCESFNASILIAKDKPIISMLESIRMLLMETVVKKRDAMKKCNLPVCPKVYKRIEKLKTWANGWIPRWQGTDQFKVEGPGNAMYKVGHNVRTYKKKNDAATTGGEGQPSAANAPPPPPNAPTQVVISVLNVNAESFDIPSTTRPTKLVVKRTVQQQSANMSQTGSVVLSK